MKNKILLFFICISLFLVSCSSDKNLFQLMPNEIHSVSTFFKVWITILIINLIAYQFLKHIGTIILFIAVLIFKDYGFFLTVLLFVLDAIFIYIFQLIRLYFYTKKDD